MAQTKVTSTKTKPKTTVSKKTEAAGKRTKQVSAASGKSVQEKRTAAKPRRANPSVKKASEKFTESTVFFQQITPYIIVVVALVLSVCFFFDGAAGVVGGGIRMLFSGLISGAAYTLPLFMLYHAVMYRADREKGLLYQKIICSCVTLLLLAVLMHLFTGGADTLNMKILYLDGIRYTGGGALGGFLGVLMRRGFGIIGTLVIVVAVLFVFVLLMFNKTPRDLVILIAYKIKTSYDAHLEKRRMSREISEITTPSEKYRNSSVTQRSSASAQKGTAPPAVYKVKSVTCVRPKVRIDEITDYGASYLEKEVDVLEEASEPTQEETQNQNVIEARIFDEVMRRTQERLEESGTAYDSSPATCEDGVIVLNPVKKTGQNIKAEIEEIAADELDLRKIFVNPDDVSLIDKIAEADVTPLGNDSDGMDSFDDYDLELPIEKAKVIEPLTPRTPTPAAVPAEVAEPEPVREYQFPMIDFLKKDETQGDPHVREELQENAIKLVETLRSFKVSTKVIGFSRGPTITRYELSPEAGTRVRSIANLVDDIALNLATTGVRIESPIPGKSAVGIEVPNKTPEIVYIRELIDRPQFRDSESKLTAILGEDVAGKAIYLDIAKMPHLLIAGATGMGKSVCINSIIVSLLYKAKPDEVKFILVDPKKVELNIYNGLPHLLVPVVSDPKKAAGSLHWAVTEMERRFEIIEAVGVRDIKQYNQVARNDPEKEFMPQVVIIIDELADLMMTAKDDVEESICRLAQKARAAGMHLILGTQRPSVDVITGLIKSNIPSRIAFTVASQIDSRTIIDIAGAEKLIGRGDMLYNPVGASKPIRVQGSFVSSEEVEAITNFLREQVNGNHYRDDVLEQIEKAAARCGQNSGKKGASAAGMGESDSDDGEADPMLKAAIELAVESGKISTSLIQRRLSLGYGRAAKLIDKMEQLGYVSPPEGQKPRNVLLTKQQYMEMVLRDDESITDGM